MSRWAIFLRALCISSLSANGLICKDCISDDWTQCADEEGNKTCAVNEVCFTAYYLHTDGREVPTVGVGRGCSVNDPERSCRMLDQTLRSEPKSRFTTNCKVHRFCSTDQCNTERPVPEFPRVHCAYCMSFPSEKNCTEETTTCPLGQMHCYRGNATIRDGPSPAKLVTAKGCTYCPTAEVACANLNSSLMSGDEGYMETCNVECCEGAVCNSDHSTMPSMLTPTASGSAAEHYDSAPTRIITGSYFGLTILDRIIRSWST